ncbi:MAG TPA: hypothetical protein VFA75_00470 [Nevskia sp.]|nr:hypothetical protein [Nevskia sp.]
MPDAAIPPARTTRSLKGTARLSHLTSPDPAFPATLGGLEAYIRSNWLLLSDRVIAHQWRVPILTVESIRIGAGLARKTGRQVHFKSPDCRYPSSVDGLIDYLRDLGPCLCDDATAASWGVSKAVVIYYRRKHALVGADARDSLSKRLMRDYAASTASPGAPRIGILEARQGAQARLNELSQQHSFQQLAAMFRTSETAVIRAFQDLGVAKAKLRRRSRIEQSAAFIRQNFLSKTDPQIAAAIGDTAAAVLALRHRLGLRKRPHPGARKGAAQAGAAARAPSEPDIASQFNIRPPRRTLRLAPDGSQSDCPST